MCDMGDRVVPEPVIFVIGGEDKERVETMMDAEDVVLDVDVRFSVDVGCVDDVEEATASKHKTFVPFSTEKCN